MINLIILKTGAISGEDITGLVESIKWSGRRGSPSRTLEFSLIDDNGYLHSRSGINIEEGCQCIFYYDKAELFRGIILSQSHSQQKTAKFKAYDLGIYLSNNHDTFSYENKTASDIFNDVCKRFGIPIGEAAQTSYIIPDLIKNNTTGWDAIADALSLDYDNTKAKHYVFAEKGKLYLRKRLENVLQWVLETGTNISNYKYEKSFESVSTRIKLMTNEGTVLAEERDEELEKKIGIFQEIDTPDESLNEAQIKLLAKTMLDEKKKAECSLNLNDMPGIPDVISGVGVFVNIPHLGLSKSFYVDSDTHTFKGNLHTMSLELNLISEMSEDNKTESNDTPSSDTDKKLYALGDIVEFHGGCHYVSSTASSPASTNLKPGPAKISFVARGAPHPWCLIHTDGQSNVYGWVDDGTFS